MTSSSNANGSVRATRTVDDLPPALSSMWRLCKLGFRHEPPLMFAAFGMALLAALPDALVALWLKSLGRGLLDHDDTLVRLAAVG